MGNCQAIDAATLVIQHPCGKVDKLYWPVTACEIMKMNPGHYVALLITTTLYKSNGKQEEKSSGGSSSSNHNHKSKDHNNSHKHSNDSKDKNSTKTITTPHSSNNSLRVTRVKLLRPTDTLTLGHVYRLISTQEVMKGLVAKKQAKLKKHGIEFEGKLEENPVVDKVTRRPQLDKNSQPQVYKQERHRSSRSSGAANGGQARPKIWQPRLQSISESAS